MSQLEAEALRAQFHALYGDRIDELFPYSINPAALRSFLGEENWQTIVDSIVANLPTRILEQVNDREIKNMFCASIRGMLTAYVVARFPAEYFDEE
jgi:hypothetical protein